MGNILKWLVVCMLAAGTTWAEYTNSTMHHALSSMPDVDGDGIPDDLMDYLSGTVLPSPYDPKGSDLDGDGMNDLNEWILGTDPLVGEPPFVSVPMANTNTNGGMQIMMQLPQWFGNYAEVFARPSLQYGEWQVVNSWIPTYGEPQICWEDVLRPEYSTFFYFIAPATFDLDGDGFSDYREYYISGTDPEAFNWVNEDGDWMHDWYELRHFGDLSQSGSDDFDGDGLPNNVELVWVSAHVIAMYSDPSLYDSDADGLSDYEELVWGTKPMDADTDGDLRRDGDELASRTDPLNPDTTPPTISFAGI